MRHTRTTLGTTTKTARAGARRRTLLTGACALLGLLSACAPSDGPGPTTRLQVTVEPPGAGTVVIQSPSAASTCDAVCTLTLPTGTTVRLEPSPADVAPFVGWEGDCSGTAPCDLTLDTDRDVMATFVPDVLWLRLDGDALLQATVTPGPSFEGSYTCTATCVLAYPGPLTVSIAVDLLEPDTVLGPWSGCASVSGPAYCLASVGGRTEVALVGVHAPSAAADAYTLFEDVPAQVDADEGLLGNDSDSPGDPLRAQLTGDGPTFGELDLDGDGAFRYVPVADANLLTTGPDGFSYQAVDAYGNVSNVAGVLLTVLPVNDAPVYAVPPGAPPVKDGAGAQVVPAFATGIGPGGGTDEAAQSVTFDVDVIETTGTLAFDVAPYLDVDGTLRYTSASGTFGSATVEATLIDDGGTDHGGVDRSEATFVITVEPLVVTLSVEGPGTAYLDPPGGVYAYDTWVVVWAQADEDAKLADWGGACASVSARHSSCALHLKSDASVTVRFEEQ